VKSNKRTIEIISTASKLFKQKGYIAVTVRDIADAMGIKAASLYNHISGKQEILANTVLPVAESFYKGIQEIESAPISVPEKLAAIIQQHVELTANNYYKMAALNNDWMHLEGELDRFLSLRNGYEELFRSIIKSGKEQGVLAYQDEEVVVFSILSTLRNLYLWIPKKAKLNKKRLTENLTQVLLEGVL